MKSTTILSGSHLHLLVLLLTCAIRLCDSLEVYIDIHNGTDTKNCWTDEDKYPCRTIQYALEVLTQNYEDIVFHISSGNYTLPDNRSVNVIHEVRNINILGTPGGTVLIQCEPEAGLVFYFSSNIKIEHVTFMECGMLQNVTSIDNTFEYSNSYFSQTPPIAYRTALLFKFCENITLSYMGVQFSKGLGVDISDTKGDVTIQYSFFTNNKVPDSEITVFPGGGGIRLSLEEDVHGATIENSLYIIRHCWFLFNNASTGPYMFRHRTVNTSSPKYIEGNGGGLSIYLHQSSKKNSINIDTCHFQLNGALFGAGLMIKFADEAHNNEITVRSSAFLMNKAYGSEKSPPGSEGGGVQLDYIHSFNVTDEYNKLLFDNSSFIGNEAVKGGGLSVVFSEVQTATSDQLPSLQISDCIFKTNLAKVGSAVYTSSWSETNWGYLPTVHIQGSYFHSNFVKFNINSTTGFGSVYSDKVPLKFLHQNSFTENVGTALLVSGTELQVDSSSKLCFDSNSGHSGGAIALVNKAWMTVNDGSELEFYSNVAHIHGGAIYVIHSGYQELPYSEFCFIRYKNRFIHPNEWNATFTFFNNTAAKQPNAIDTPSLLSCVWPESKNSSLEHDIQASLCWEGWYYQQSNCSEQVRTAGAYYFKNENVSLSEMQVFPGRQITLPFQFHDDKNVIITSTYVLSAAINGNQTFVQQYVSNGVITLYGKPGDGAKLALDTVAPRLIITTINITFLPCPPGFEAVYLENLDSYQCQCSGNYKQTVVCDSENFNSYIQWGFFMTYNEETSQTLVAPWVVYTYSFNFKSDLPGFLSLSNRLEELNNFTCNYLGRTGFVCKECLPNKSPPVYAYTFECIDCDDDELVVNWLYYILLDFLPVTIFFLIVVVLNISTTSGPANAYIFFAQVIANPITVTRATNQLYAVIGKDHKYFLMIIKAIFILPYSIWNLDFFSVILQPFCVVKDIKNIHAYTINYITAFYPLFLIAVAYICIQLYARNNCLIVCLWKPFSWCFAKIRRNWELRASVVDAFATFLLLSYTKFCLLTFYLLVPLWTFDSAGDKVGDYRLFFDPSVIYLGDEHKPYFALAIVVLFFVIILPPIFLFIYPTAMFQNLLNRMRIQGTAVHMFAETFQGCYKDGLYFGSSDCRYFASLYFVIRIIAFSSIVLSYDIFIQRLIQLMIITSVIVIFSIVRPYKDDYYNKLDPFIFGSLLVTLTVSMYNAAVPNVGIVVSVILMISILIPLIYMTGYVIKNLFRILKLCCQSGPIEYQPRLSVSALMHSEQFAHIDLEDSAGSLPDRIINPNNYFDREIDSRNFTRSVVGVDNNYGSTNSSSQRLLND